MTTYLMSVCYPADATAPSPTQLDRITTEVNRVHEEMAEAGAWVFGGGLHDASTSTVVRAHDGEVMVTDGPFAETKEQLGGLSIIDVADLDTAMVWAEKLSRATTCPIEVRPFQNSSS